MSEGGYRFMWFFVFFDLPVKTKPQRKRATQFRKFLLDDGYMMIQFSVYARPCNGHEGVAKHSSRLLANLPTEGSVRCLPVTESQYARMGIHVGKKTIRERKSGPQPITFFDMLWAENPEDPNT